MSNRNSILMSIKPEFVELIFSGEKTVELRRVVPKEIPLQSHLIIYSSSPDKCIVGRARIKKVHKLPINKLWKELGAETGITYGYFKKYFLGKEYGYGLAIDKVERFSRAISLEELKKALNFTPPQSFMYPSEDLLEALQ
jgi:predicted transcriptional regulator